MKKLLVSLLSIIGLLACNKDTKPLPNNADPIVKAYKLYRYVSQTKNNGTTTINKDSLINEENIISISITDSNLSFNNIVYKRNALESKPYFFTNERNVIAFNNELDSVYIQYINGIGIQSIQTYFGVTY